MYLINLIKFLAGLVKTKQRFVSAIFKHRAKFGTLGSHGSPNV